MMASNGGVWSVSRIIDFAGPLGTLRPVAAVIGAGSVGESAGYPNLIAYGTGGTSTHTPAGQRKGRDTSRSRAMKGSGAYPIKLQQIEINSISAGARSIGGLEAGRVLAGRLGLVGSEATVTDANLVLGQLDSRRALRGEICLDTALAADAIDRFAAQVGLDWQRLAGGSFLSSSLRRPRASRRRYRFCVDMTRGF